MPGLVILLSGAGLSFAKEIDRFMQPGLLSVAASGEVELPVVHSIIADQLRLHPQWVLEQLRYPRSPYDPITLSVHVENGNRDASTLVYLNPHTGKLLGQRPRASELAERLRRLHVELISVSVGQNLAVITGLALLVMIALGVCLVRVKGGWRLNSWHARLGLLIAPIMLSIVGSGLISVVGTYDTGFVSERVAGTAQAKVMSEHFRGFLGSQFPAACDKRPVSVAVVNNGLRLRCEDGVILKLTATATSQNLEVVRESGQILWNLHSGEWAGLAGRGIWMWSVLAVLYLLYSGIRDWWHRKIKKVERE